jgi:hypothetical protein
VGENAESLLPLTRSAIATGAVALDDGAGGRDALAAWLVHGTK